MKNKLVLTCLIVAIIGIALAGIGTLFGGRVYGFNVGKGVHVNSNLNLGSEYKYIEENKELEAFKNLDMNMNFVDVRVEEADSFSIEYRVREDRAIETRVDGDTLVISQKNPHGNITLLSFGNVNVQNTSESEYLILNIPEGEKFGSFSITNDCGDIDLPSLQADTLTINDSFGNLDVDTLQAAETDLSLESGDINVKRVQTDSLLIKDSFGNVSIGSSDAANSTISIESGDVKLDEMKGKEAEIITSFGKVAVGDAAISDRITCKVESGDIEFETLETKEATFKSSFGKVTGNCLNAESVFVEIESGNFIVDDLTASTVDGSTSFGGMELGLRESVDDYSINAQTEFGEVKVNGEEQGEHYNAKQASGHTLSLKTESGDIVLFDVK